MNVVFVGAYAKAIHYYNNSEMSYDCFFIAYGCVSYILFLVSILASLAILSGVVGLYCYDENYFYIYLKLIRESHKNLFLYELVPIFLCFFSPIESIFIRITILK